MDEIRRDTAAGGHNEHDAENKTETNAARKAREKAERKKRLKEEPLKKKLVWWTLYVLIAAMMLTGVYLLLKQNTMLFVPKATPPPSLSTPVPIATPTPQESAEPTETPEPEPIAPLAVYFSVPGYKCDVYPVGRTENNLGIATLDSATDAAWFDESATPGAAGNCIINGHNSFNKQMGTFSYLKEMDYGEEVIVEREDGSLVYYEVYSIDEFPYESFPAFILSQEGFDRLTLITCLGDYERSVGQSLTRVVVTCKPVGIAPAPEETA